MKKGRGRKRQDSEAVAEWEPESFWRHLNPHTVDTKTITVSGVQGEGCPCSIGQAFTHLVLSLLQALTKPSAHLQKFPGDRAASLGAVVEPCGSMHKLKGLSHGCPLGCSLGMCVLGQPLF